MEYIGNRPNPYPDDPTYRWWLDPNWIYGGMNPPPFGPEGAGEPGGGRGGGGGQQAPNEGEVVETPEGTDPGSFAPGTGNPVFKTETIGNQPAPLETLPTEFGQLDPTLADYLATLPVHEGGGTGGGGDYKTYFTDPSGSGGGGGTETGGGGNTNTYWDFPDTGGSGDYKTYFTDPPAEERGNTYTYFSDPSFGDPTKGNTYTYFTDPSAKDYHTYFAPVPTTPPTTTRPPINGPVITTPPRNPPTELPPLEFPPIRTNPQQPQQQNPIGQVLAALPMLAAFQGGTTTTPAPYAHLGPHTPVAPVFKPQARGNPIPSIGQLLAGVR